MSGRILDTQEFRILDTQEFRGSKILQDLGHLRIQGKQDLGHPTESEHPGIGS